MRVLAVVSEPIDADALRAALGGSEVTDDAEVLVVSPALHASGLRFWMSDDDEAIARAQAVQEETVERLEEAGVDAAGDTGEADPMTAIEDALQSFAADRIVIFSHPEGEQRYREEELAEAQQRFGVPVVQGEISA
jgi:hypothetical protein